MERTEDNTSDCDAKSYIPHEITSEEILPRLPVKTIFRCRSVCKLWGSLPFDTKFVEMHLNRSLTASKSNIIILSYGIEDYLSIVSFYSLDLADNGNTTKLMTISLFMDKYAMEPSCNGLVCFSSLCRPEIYVCNPSTHEFIRLPEVSRDENGVLPNSKVAGFGFDQSTRKYKVVCAFPSPSVLDDNRKCFIFTLDSVDCNWRQLDDMPYRIQPTQGAYLNEAVHWIIEGSPNYLTPGGILSLSFQDEKYRILTLPNCDTWEYYMDLWGLHSSSFLKVLGGFLHLVTTIDGSDAGWWRLLCWKLEDYMNHVWTCEFSFSFNITCESMRSHPPAPVDIRNRKVLLSSGRKLFTYDLETNILSEVSCDFPGGDDLNVAKIYQPNHVESLVSINGNHVGGYGIGIEDQMALEAEQRMQAMVRDLLGD